MRKTLNEILGQRQPRQFSKRRVEYYFEQFFKADDAEDKECLKGSLAVWQAHVATKFSENERKLNIAKALWKAVCHSAAASWSGRRLLMCEKTHYEHIFKQIVAKVSITDDLIEDEDAIDTFTTQNILIPLLAHVNTSFEKRNLLACRKLFFSDEPATQKQQRDWQTFWHAQVVARTTEQQRIQVERLLNQVVKALANAPKPVSFVNQPKHYIEAAVQHAVRVVKSEGFVFEQLNIRDFLADLKKIAPRSIINGLRKRGVRDILASREWHEHIHSNHLSAVQEHNAVKLLFATSKCLARPPECLDLVRQSPQSLKRIFNNVTQHITHPDYSPDAAQASAAQQIALIEHEANKRTTTLQQARFQGGGAFDNSLLYAQPHATLMQDNHVMMVLPSDNSAAYGIECMGLFDIRTSLDAFCKPEALPKLLWRRPHVKHILFAVGDGIHWRAAHIEKPAVAGEGKFTIYLFDSYGPESARAIGSHMNALLNQCKVPEEQVEMKLIDTASITTLQTDGVSCGYYAASFLHYTVARLIKEEIAESASVEGSLPYDPNVVETFQARPLGGRTNQDEIRTAIRELTLRRHQQLRPQEARRLQAALSHSAIAPPYSLPTQLKAKTFISPKKHMTTDTERMLVEMMALRGSSAKPIKTTVAAAEQQRCLSKKIMGFEKKVASSTSITLPRATDPTWGKQLCLALEQEGLQLTREIEALKAQATKEEKFILAKLLESDKQRLQDANNSLQPWVSDVAQSRHVLMQTTHTREDALLAAGRTLDVLEGKRIASPDRSSAVLDKAAKIRDAVNKEGMRLMVNSKSWRIDKFFGAAEKVKRIERAICLFNIEVIQKLQAFYSSDQGKESTDIIKVYLELLPPLFTLDNVKSELTEEQYTILQQIIASEEFKSHPIRSSYLVEVWNKPETPLSQALNSKRFSFWGYSISFHDWSITLNGPSRALSKIKEEVEGEEPMLNTGPKLPNF